MKTFLILSSVFALAACGDNAAKCGPGTTEIDGDCTSSVTCGSGTQDDGTGVCVPNGNVICTDGTTFEVATGTCVIDPTDCQGGTVLINGACQNPDAGLVVNLEEGPEPNGLGVHGLEVNAVVPAGTITLPAIGSDAFVIHGHITPFQTSDDAGDLDPDLDTYELAVTAPTLIEVTADGVNGLAAAFQALPVAGTTGPLAKWSRLGINLAGDTAKRQLFLPAAGTYELAITDVRTLFLQQAATAGPTDYYVSITQLAIPTPTLLTTGSDGAVAFAGALGNDAPLFYRAPLQDGLDDMQLSIVQSSAVASLVVLVDDQLRHVVDAVPTTSPDGGSLGTLAELAVAPPGPVSTNLFVVDAAYDYAQAPVNFNFTIAAASSMQLPTGGGSATQTVPGALAAGTLAAHAIPHLTQWELDVTTAGEIFGGILTWDSPVDGFVLDQDGNILSPFSYDPQTGFGATTWRTYNGLLRFPTPGRYFFAVTTATATTITATSTFAPVTPAQLPLDGTTITVAQPDVPAYNGIPYLVTATTTPWGYFYNVSGNGSLLAFDSSAAFGRLTAVTLGAGTRAPDPTVLGTEALDAEARLALGGTTTSYLFELVDLNTFGAGVSIQMTPSPPNILDGISPPFSTTESGLTNRYMLSGPPGSIVSIDAEDDSEAFVLESCGFDPSTCTTLAAAGSTVDAVVEEGADGYVVFETGVLNDPGSVTFTYAAPPTYTVTTGSDAFVEQCGSGTPGQPIAFGADGLATGVPYLSRFTYFGIPTPAVTMSANGFLSFHTPPGALPVNAALPAAADAFSIVAPYWTNLDGVTACANVIAGLKATYEWNGHLAGDLAHVVQMQVILRLADNSIEFVYGPNHTAGGATASIGLQDSLGIIGKSVAFHTPHAVAAGTSTKLTPSM